MLYHLYKILPLGMSTRQCYAVLGLWNQPLLTKGKMCYNAPYKSLNLYLGN
jgi:hypothetical protein